MGSDVLNFPGGQEVGSSNLPSPTRNKGPEGSPELLAGSDLAKERVGLQVLRQSDSQPLHSGHSVRTLIKLGRSHRALTVEHRSRHCVDCLSGVTVRDRWLDAGRFGYRRIWTGR